MKPLIAKPEDIRPNTSWLDTKWAWTGEEELIDHTTNARLCAAALLPFRDRKPDWEGFVASIRWMQVDGTHGSAIVGLRKCWVQSIGTTPRPTWNPDIDQPIDFFGGWQEVPDSTTYDNAFNIQWEEFLKHVAVGTPFPWSLREGAKGVQLAELGQQSWAQRKWLPVEALPA